MIDQQSFLEGPQRGEFEIPDGATVKRCQSCGAMITWVTTAKGNAMPVDLARLRVSGSTSYGRSHFATCPDAVAWRRATRDVIQDMLK
jgi:uncharacterized ParB-like nuclease family protein